MTKSMKAVRFLSCAILLMAVITTSAGLFWQTAGSPFFVQNTHGDSVRMFGQGLYAYDSFFQAGINKGTDMATLFAAVPVLIAAVVANRKTNLQKRFFLTGILAYFLYYSTSIAFGVAYNALFPLYLLLFSASLFAFVLSFLNLVTENLTGKIGAKMPSKGIALLLIFAGLSVFVWLFDIIGAIANGRPPQSITVYTTQPSYLLDLGVIAPSAFLCSWLLFHNRQSAYPLAAALLTICSLIGIVVILQTVVQMQMGVVISIGQLIAYVGIFVFMSGFAILFHYRLLKNIHD